MSGVLLETTTLSVHRFVSFPIMRKSNKREKHTQQLYVTIIATGSVVILYTLVIFQRAGNRMLQNEITALLLLNLHSKWPIKTRPVERGKIPLLILSCSFYHTVSAPSSTNSLSFILFLLRSRKKTAVHLTLSTMLDIENPIFLPVLFTLPWKRVRVTIRSMHEMHITSHVRSNERIIFQRHFHNNIWLLQETRVGKR